VMADGTKANRILTFDVGGTGLKAAIVGPTGKILTERLRVMTPHPCPPKVMVKALVELAACFNDYDHVAIGFPGFVRAGVVITAPNLDTKVWAGNALERTMQRELRRPVRLLNDADVQGLAVITGRGLELVCTLGTGFGTAWFRDGELMPHMDLAHFSLHSKHDLDRYIGDHTLKKIGKKRWNKRLAEIVPMLVNVFNYDRLFLGGGNARLVNIDLPKNVFLSSNDAGMEGGAFVWNPRGPKSRQKS
jgi:polyphosphate glucokinase